MTETQFIREYRASLKAKYPQAFIRKILGGAFASGLPDLYICNDGLSLWVEVKIKQSKKLFDIQSLPSANQKAVMRDMASAGANVYLVAVCKDAAIVSRYLHKIEMPRCYADDATMIRGRGGVWQSCGGGKILIGIS